MIKGWGTYVMDLPFVTTSYSIPPALLTFSGPTRVQCVDVPVSDDQIVEEGERILLSLSPINMPLMVDPGSVTTAVVMVIDDDGECT